MIEFDTFEENDVVHSLDNSDRKKNSVFASSYSFTAEVQKAQNVSKIPEGAMRSTRSNSSRIMFK